MRFVSKTMTGLVAVAALAGCIVQEHRGPEPTNESLVRQAAANAAQLVASSPALGNAHKVVIASLERPDVSDYAVQAEIEDALHEALDIAGVRTLERDPDVILRLAYQEGTPYLENLVLAHTSRRDAPFDPRQQQLVWVDSRGEEHIVQVETGPVTGHAPIPSYMTDADKPFHVVPTSIGGRQLSELASADFVVAYRVLEHGIEYRDAARRPYSARLIKRQALTRLHVRIINAKSGEVVWARTLEGEQVDEVPVVLLPKLERPQRGAYAASSPMRYNNVRNRPEAGPLPATALDPWSTAPASTTWGGANTTQRGNPASAGSSQRYIFPLGPRAGSPS